MTERDYGTRIECRKKNASSLTERQWHGLEAFGVLSELSGGTQKTTDVHG